MGISVVAGAVGGGALSGAFSVMMADAHTEARVASYAGQRSELRSTGGSVEVVANTLTKMNVRENAGDYLQGVGAVSVGGVGAGASVEVMVLRERTLASIDDYSLVHAAGDIRVEALLERDINSAVLAFTASGTLSLNGAISVISLGAGLSEDAVADVEELGQLVSGSFAGFANGDYAMQESASSGDSGIEDDDDDPYDPEDFERDFDAPANAGNQNQANRKTTNQALDELTFQVSFDVEKNGQVIGDTTAKVGRFTELDAGGDIVVEAKELLEVGIVTGGAAISGAASVGISIAVLELNGAVSTTVGYGSSLAADGQIRVASHAELNSNLHAVGGAAALGIAIGGQSTIILDRSIQQAYIEDAGTPAQAVVINTPGNLTLSASVDRQHQALAAGGSIGKVAAGISVGVVEISGATQAWLGERAILGDDTLLNNVMVSATSLDRVNLTVVAVAAGLAGAGTANVSTVSLSNDVQAWLGSGITLSALGDVVISALHTPRVSVESLGVAVSAGVGIGASVVVGNLGTRVLAQVGTPGGANSDISLRAANLTVEAGSTLLNDAPSLYARAVGSAGGALLGLNATVITLRDNARAEAVIGNTQSNRAAPGEPQSDNNIEVAGHLRVVTDLRTTLEGRAISVVGGLVAAGAAVVDVRQNTQSRARIGDGHLIGAGRVSVEAGGHQQAELYPWPAAAVWSPVPVPVTTCARRPLPTLRWGPRPCPSRRR